MSASKDVNSPINRAHALSAKASQTAQISSTVDNLSRASEMYGEAADLFEQVKKDSSDSGAITTLTLLSAQNRKKSKDLARRASVARSSGVKGGGNEVAAKEKEKEREKDVDVGVRGDRQQQRRRRTGTGTGTGMANSTSSGHTAPVHTFSPALPFARPSPVVAPPLLPAASTSTSGSTSALSSIDSRIRERPSSRDLAQPKGGLSGPGSMMYASSSSSDRGGTGDSFVKFGHPLESSDPFARFWAVLETAFDQISNPVAFAAAPLDIERVGKKAKEKEKGKGKEDDSFIPPEPTSPLSADSFEVVHKKAVGVRAGAGAGGKTPEELALENEHLRASLDALSKHTMQVEQELKRVKDREGMLKSVVLGVKAEAQKVMQSQVLSRSQMPASRVGFNGFNTRGPDSEQRRVVDLEEQVKFLQAENERARSHLQKYKDRFEKLKTSARAKKEAKLIAAGGPLATLGEEDGEGA